MSIVTTCVVFGQSQWELRSERIVVAPHDSEVKLVPVAGDAIPGRKMAEIDVWWGVFNHYSPEQIWDAVEAWHGWVEEDRPRVAMMYSSIDREVVYGFFGDDGLRHATAWDPGFNPVWPVEDPEP